MDPEYYGQMQRLQQFRRSLAEQNEQDGAVSLTQVCQEVDPGGKSTQYDLRTKGNTARSGVENEPLQDPLIYPGVYAPSGFDMMGILIRVRTRPNPVVDIGSVDSSVALVLCDTALPHLPIVYCSEPFEALTGYCSTEVLGNNCRFLQRPSQSTLNNANGTSEVDQINENPRAELREKISRGEEAQVRLVNYTKAGVKFLNLLTIIPIAWDEGELGRRYIVGFQAQDNA